MSRTEFAELNSKKSPFLSLIIPTYNRHDIIVDTVKKFLDQDYPRFEIVVVDQTPGASRNVLSEFFELKENRVRYVHIDEPGLPNARNVGIEAAEGDIVLFADDDAEPLDKNFIFQHARHYEDPGIVGVTGRVIDDRAKPTHDPENILKLTRWGTSSCGFNGTVRTRIDTAYGCNMSFRTNDCIEAGLFDKRIVGSAEGEELEFSLRLRKTTGKSLIFEPEACLIHQRRTIGGCESRSILKLQRHFWRFHNQAFIASRNKDQINPCLFFLGRLLSIINISFESKSVKPFYWLPWALFSGYRTSRQKEASARMIAQVKNKLN